ncbi:MAG: helix-turn-helix domain-containing protein [Eubacterium sp.]|nr:helix-turn-helix domain-containing protein [Eubacterium sp.]
MNIYFSENLKKFRIESKLTQEALANQLGVSFQAVSKWERGDSYPDITMLPVIASFFKVSVDDLLGVNRAENETEIAKLIEDYDNLTDAILKKEILDRLIEKAPNDFRILLREMSYLIHFESKTEILPRVHSIYENIRQNCTSDKIRLSAKRHIAQLYESLSQDKCNGIAIDDIENMINDFPSMLDTREYLATLFHHLTSDAHKQACGEAIEKELVLLDNTISHMLFYMDRFENESQFKEPPYKISAIEMMNEIYSKIYTDGNYGQNWRFIIYNYGHLGHLYFQAGNSQKALDNLKICAELAKQFDNLPEVTTHTSMLLNGKKFNKITLGSTYIACSQMKRLILEKYPLSVEFKNSHEFKEIIEILN